MNPNQFSVIKELINTLQKSIDFLSSDRDHDAKEVNKIQNEMQEIRIRLGAVESQIDELRKDMKHQAENIQNKVGEAVQPVIDGTEDLRKTIKNKKTMVMKVKRFNWKFW